MIDTLSFTWLTKTFMELLVYTILEPKVKFSYVIFRSEFITIL